MAGRDGCPEDGAAIRARNLSQLVEAWAAGWACTRKLSLERTGRVLRITVNGASRRLEYVLADPDEDEFAGLAKVVAQQSDVWLTVFSSDPNRFRLLAPELDVAVDGEAFMARRIEAVQTDDEVLIEDWVRIDDDGRTARARLQRGGEIAAIGSVALAGTSSLGGLVGPSAVFDRIETMPSFRRQGLGSRIMEALTQWAAGQGAHTGLLAASPGGQRLYTKLGWETVSRMVSFRSPPGTANAGSDDTAAKTTTTVQE